eukprot:9370356-Heterocapsa_arctica.AAC.1
MQATYTSIVAVVGTGPERPAQLAPPPGHGPALLSWLRHQDRLRRKYKEYVSGEGQLGLAWARLPGSIVLLSLESYCPAGYVRDQDLSRPVVVRRELDLVRHGDLDGGRFGSPCTSFYRFLL